MRLLSTLIIMVVTIFGSCKSNDEILNKGQIEADKEAILNTNLQKDILTIAYRASSRGFFEYTLVAAKDIMLTEDRNLVDTRTYVTNAEDWSELLDIVGSIDEDELQNLKAPTSKRLYDGAPHASITITKGDKEVT